MSRMDQPSHQIETYRRGNRVKRYHTLDLLFPETVGEHSANVALICHWLLREEMTRELYFAALTHDVAEQFTGDVPYPAKASWPGLANELRAVESTWMNENIPPVRLTPEEVSVLKAADMLDLLLKIRHEIDCGNHDLIPVFYAGITAISTIQLNGAASARFAAIKKELNTWLKAQELSTSSK